MEQFPQENVSIETPLQSEVASFNIKRFRLDNLDNCSGRFLQARDKGTVYYCIAIAALLRYPIQETILSVIFMSSLPKALQDS